MEKCVPFCGSFIQVCNSLITLCCHQESRHNPCQDLKEADHLMAAAGKKTAFLGVLHLYFCNMPSPLPPPPPLIRLRGGFLDYKPVCSVDYSGWQLTYLPFIM
uniref:Uncharacterized protein n=1 Tax=Opuntia streptacantha TaxID=393608 RepID=A0A7C9DTG9_OPUST